MTSPALALWLTFCTVPHYYGVPGVSISYEPVVSYWADVYKVHRGLAAALVREESGFRPYAQAYKSGKRFRKSIVAHGIAMVTANPRHLADHVRRSGIVVYNWRNPSDSLRVGMCYLGILLRYFDGDRRPAIASYNCGLSRARDWWYNGRPLPRETVRYLKGVFCE